MTLELKLDSFKQKIEPRIAAAMTKNKLPGMALSIVHEDKIIYSRGFGSRNIKKFLPYTPDTLNGFGSCTKSFTCLAIMNLASQGTLELNDPVSKYVPLKLGNDEHPITIHHFMSHTSGVPNLGSAETIIVQSFPISMDVPLIPLSSWDDFYTHYNQAEKEVFSKPGETFFYLNGGYTILGHIIEKVSGMKFEEYIRKYILDPLNMKRSGLLESYFAKDANISTPYIMVPDKEKTPQPTPATFPFSPFIYAAGGLISSVKEMANYLIMVMNDGKFEEKQLFKADLLNEVQKMHTGIVHPYLSSFGESGYGYGWGITKDFFGHTLLAHSGGVTGGISYIGFFKEIKLGFASIGNAEGFPTKEILAALALLLGKDPDKELPFIVRDNHYNKLCGEYATYQGIIKGSIVNKLGLLYVETNLPPTSMPLIPVDECDEPLEFYYTNEFGVKMPVKFIIDEDKKVHLAIERNVFHKI